MLAVIAIPYLTKAAETPLANVPPYQAQQYLAYDAALLLFVPALLIIILGRVVASISRRDTE